MSDTKELPPIPPALLKLLEQAWRVEQGYQAWDAAWNRNAGERQRDPSGYVLRKGSAEPNPITHAEAAALLEAGFLAGLAKPMEGGGLWLNEHAAHAISDFGSDVYAAWQKLRQRLAQAAAADRIAG